MSMVPEKTKQKRPKDVIPDLLCRTKLSHFLPTKTWNYKKGTFEPRQMQSYSPRPHTQAAATRQKPESNASVPRVDHYILKQIDDTKKVSTSLDWQSTVKKDRNSVCSENSIKSNESKSFSQLKSQSQGRSLL